jgi:hypothetical protein
MALRAHNEALQGECNRLLAQSERFAAVAEMAQGSHTEAKGRMQSICSALADMHAGLAEFLKCP